MQQIILNTNSQKINQAAALVGSEAKNPLPTILHKIDVMENNRLHWIFTNEMIPNETFIGEENN